MTSLEYEINKEPDLAPIIINSINSNNLANIASNQTMFIANRDAIDRTGLMLVDTSNRNGTEILNSLAQKGSDIILAVEKTRGDINGNVISNSGDIKTSITEVSGKILLSQEKIIGETKQLILENNNNTITIGKDIELELCKTSEQLTLQASENVGKVEICINNVKTHLELQIATITSTIQIEALKNIQVLSAQMMDCCCQLKEMLTTTTNATHQLIRELENIRVKDALQNANMEIMMKKLSNN